jgi:MarR family transcriptional regulator, organic hydroperoxide resistance regulator
MVEDEEPTGLEAMLCFELYAASRAMTGLYRPVLDAAGITYPQYVALRVIWTRERISVRDLGTHLHLDSGTLSPLLKRLETQDLIRRTRGSDDERVVWITPGPRSDEMKQTLADLPERIACALDLDLDEFRTVHRLLGRIRGAATTQNL